VLKEINKKLKDGKCSEINILEIIYLPLYGSASGKTTSDLLDEAIKLTSKAIGDKHKQHKLQDLLILLTVSFIGSEELNKILEANMKILEDSPVIKFFEDRFLTQGLTQGRNQTMIEIATNMLQRGRNIQEVSEDTGLDISKVAELQAELQPQPPQKL